MSFHRFGLHADLLKALDQLGYHEPTPIQEQAIPVALTGRDLIGCAQTGTGKTAAFALPILNRLHPIMSGKIRALILTPTRELAAQINEVMQGLIQFTKLYTAAIYGGVGIPPQQRALRLATDVIVATPGRLLDHMKNGVGRFDGLEVLVLDEADRMLDMGFLPDVNRIIARLPPQRQTMMFSATMSQEIRELSRKILREPVTVQVGRQAAPAEGVSQSAYPVPGHLKTELLMALLQQHEMESVLVFTRTKDRTERLARRLKESGFKAAMIHGDRTQGQRLAALAGFRERAYRILVATDIAARGLDIDGISHVINFDVPVTPADYVHRIGRTARAQALGDALTLVTPVEENAFSAIQQLIKVKIPRHTLAGFDYNQRSSATAEPRERRHRRFVPRGYARRNGGPTAGRSRSRRFAFN